MKHTDPQLHLTWKLSMRLALHREGLTKIVAHLLLAAGVFFAASLALPFAYLQLVGL